MKKIYKAINTMYFKNYVNMAWTRKYPNTGERVKIMYEYFNKTKDDLTVNLKYDYELSTGQNFEEILYRNPYKFKKGLFPSEIDNARFEASTKSFASVVRKYINREVLDSNFVYDPEKVAKVDSAYKKTLDEYINRVVKLINKKSSNVEIEDISNNEKLLKIFRGADYIAVNDVDKIIYPIFTILHIENQLPNEKFCLKGYLYDERDFVNNKIAKDYVKKEEKRLRLENNGPEVLNSESFAAWIGNGLNDEVLDEYFDLFIDINRGGLFYLKICIEENRGSELYEQYESYRICQNIIMYNPITDDKYSKSLNGEPVYMNTDFSQRKELVGKYE